MCIHTITLRLLQQVKYIDHLKQLRIGMTNRGIIPSQNKDVTLRSEFIVSEMFCTKLNTSEVGLCC